jgi:TRAP-type C4-dicarboxylate transport system permease small subunit
MARYETVSGAVFTFVALVQGTRAVLGLPARVGTLDIPIWFSYVIFVVTGALAVWGFRRSRRGA